MNNLLKAFTFTSLLVSLSACSTHAVENIKPALLDTDFTITSLDQPEQNRFVIIINSKSDRDICLFKGQWPDVFLYKKDDPRGEGISYIDAEMSVTISNQLLKPKEVNVGGHCGAPSVAEQEIACSQRLEPNQSRATSVPYAYFKDFKQEYAQMKKELSFEFSPPFCLKQS